MISQAKSIVFDTWVTYLKLIILYKISIYIIVITQNLFIGLNAWEWKLKFLFMKILSSRDDDEDDFEF